MAFVGGFIIGFCAAVILCSVAILALYVRIVS